MATKNKYRINYAIEGWSTMFPLWYYVETSSKASAILQFEKEAEKCSTKVLRYKTEEITGFPKNTRINYISCEG